MYPAVTDVKPASNYTLLLTFNNGERKKFDMKPYLHLAIFRELKDVAKFNDVRVSFDTIEWGNEADIDPEVLFQDGETI
ncbi:MAG: DUF2442 domain-containing protein [Bacteroidota bacterium]